MRFAEAAAAAELGTARPLLERCPYISIAADQFRCRSRWSVAGPLRIVADRRRRRVQEGGHGRGGPSDHTGRPEQECCQEPCRSAVNLESHCRRSSHCGAAGAGRVGEETRRWVEKCGSVGRNGRRTSGVRKARPRPDRLEATATSPAHRSVVAIRWSCSVNGGARLRTGTASPGRLCSFVGPEWGELRLGTPFDFIITHDATRQEPYVRSWGIVTTRPTAPRFSPVTSSLLPGRRCPRGG